MPESLTLDLFAEPAGHPAQTRPHFDVPELPVGQTAGGSYERPLVDFWSVCVRTKNSAILLDAAGRLCPVRSARVCNALLGRAASDRPRPTWEDWRAAESMIHGCGWRLEDALGEAVCADLRAAAGGIHS